MLDVGPLGNTWKTLGRHYEISSYFFRQENIPTSWRSDGKLRESLGTTVESRWVPCVGQLGQLVKSHKLYFLIAIHCKPYFILFSWYRDIHKGCNDVPYLFAWLILFDRNLTCRVSSTSMEHSIGLQGFRAILWQESPTCSISCYLKGQLSSIQAGDLAPACHLFVSEVLWNDLFPRRCGGNSHGDWDEVVRSTPWRLQNCEKYWKMKKDRDRTIKILSL